MSFVLKRSSIAILFCSTAVGAHAQLGYNLTDIGLLSGGTYSEALSINDSGQVVGYADTPQGTRGFVWSASKGMKILKPLLGDAATFAIQINNNGVVAGYSGADPITGPGFLGRAVTWNLNGNPTLVGGLAGFTYSIARGVNDSGEISGISYNTFANRESWFRATGGSFQDLGLPSGATASDILIMNNVHQVAGYYIDGSNNRYPFIWSSASGYNLLPGLSGSTFNQAIGLNNAGQVVGRGIVSGHDHAMFFSPTTGTLDLARPAGANDADAYGINDWGVVVGEFGIPDETSSSNISGYVWNAIVGMIDLNTLLAQSPPAGWRIINAETINNHGQIGAMVSVNGGPDRAVLLTPSVSGVPL